MDENEKRELNERLDELYRNIQQLEMHIFYKQDPTRLQADKAYLRSQVEWIKDRLDVIQVLAERAREEKEKKK